MQIFHRLDTYCLLDPNGGRLRLKKGYDLDLVGMKSELIVDVDDSGGVLLQIAHILF